MGTILVVDDDAGFRESVVETLRGLNHETVEAADGETALRALAAGGIDAILLDYKLGAEKGTDVLRIARERCGDALPPVLVLTAYVDAHGTIEAMRLGAFDHVEKPIGREQIADFLRKALVKPGSSTPTSAQGSQQLVGASPAMREVHKLIGRAASSDATVLISGETGTGKEVVARTLHEFSHRSRGPFVAVNCAAIPADLLESELFGHGKGAFSGAVAVRVGCFEQAHGGTLLLDEIGDMPLAMQAKILRVLQERRIVRLGEMQERQLDVRLIAASHRDLEAMARAGKFRADLFFRLNVLRIHMPPLRERRQDIVPLAEYFLSAPPAAPRVLSAAAKQHLESLDWPGNVRELRNAMERVRVMAPTNLIDVDDLAFLAERRDDAQRSDAPMSDAVTALERDLVVAALAQAKGNRSDAARRLGISRAQLYRKLRAFNLAD